MELAVPVVVIAAVLLVATVAAVVTLSVLLTTSRRALAAARMELDRMRDEQGRRRRRQLGVGPLAVRTVWKTADSLLNKGIGATVRNSIEDLAGWARVERPDLARLTAGGDVVIAFSDIEGSTELNEALGDREWIKVLDRHNKLIGKAVDSHGGYVVKNQGDGFMIAFADPVQAVRCGIAIQQALDGESERRQPIRVRIGMHMGRSVRRGDDLFGRNVAMAARVANEADGGQILISEAMRDALGGESDIALDAPREVQLKGLSGSHEVFPVRVG